MSEIHEVHQSEIVDSRWQTREDGYSGPKFEELVASIAANGITSPAVGFINEVGQYELVSFHRRMAVVRELAIDKVPFIVKVDLTEVTEPAKQEWLDRFQQAVLADNMGHEDLTPLELARALRDIIQQQDKGQAEVGQLYGKSQQWVSDKLALLDLAPEVQKSVTERAVEETVAKKIAQLPEKMQGPVAKYVKGRTSRDATEVIDEIKEAMEPGFWDLPEDKPWEPSHISMKLMMDDALDQVDAEDREKVLLNLHKARDLKPADEHSPWFMSSFVKTCGLEALSLEDWAVGRGRTCDSCLWYEDRLFYDCRDEEAKTCMNYLGPEDEMRMRIPFDADEDCQTCEKETGWCTDPACYILKTQAARDAREEERGEKDLEKAIVAQDELRAHYDRQMREDVDREHWLAQSCKTCLLFKGPDHRDQCATDRPRQARVELWESNGVIVPRCSIYQMRNLTAIPGVSKETIREVMLSWLKWLADGYAGEKLAYLLRGGKGPLHKTLEESELNTNQLAYVVGQAINARIDSLAYGSKYKQLNPLTGEWSKWKPYAPQAEEQPETEEAGAAAANLPGPVVRVPREVEKELVAMAEEEQDGREAVHEQV